MTTEPTPVKSSGAAIRAQRYRKRRADGVVAVLRIEVTQNRIELLERLMLLADDKTEWDDVARAIEALLDRGDILADALEALDRWRNA